MKRLPVLGGATWGLVFALIHPKSVQMEFFSLPVCYLPRSFSVAFQLPLAPLIPLPAMLSSALFAKKWSALKQI